MFIIWFFFFCLRLILFPSCIAHHLSVKPKSTVDVNHIWSEHKNIFLNRLTEYITDQQRLELNRSKSNIEYAKDYLMPSEDNPFGLIKPLYCNLMKGYALTPLTTITHFKGKDKQDVALEDIKNMFIISGCLYLMSRNLSRYIEDKQLMNNNVMIKGSCKEVHNIASQASKNFGLGMPFVDVIYEGFDDIFKRKEKMVHELIALGVPFPIGYSKNLKDEHSNALTNLRNLKEVMQIVCQEYQDKNTILAITDAQYAYKERLEVIDIQTKAIELYRKVGQRPAAEFYVKAVDMLEGTQENYRERCINEIRNRYDDLIQKEDKCILEDPAVFKKVQKAYADIVKKYHQSSNDAREAYKLKSQHQSTNDQKKEVLENVLSIYPNPNKDDQIPDLPVDVVKQIAQGNSNMLQAIRKVRDAHLSEIDPAKEAIEEAFKEAAATPMRPIDEVAEWINGPKTQKTTKRNKSTKQTNIDAAKKSQKQAKNKQTLQNSFAKGSIKVDDSKKTFCSILDKKKEASQETNIVLQPIEELRRRLEKSSYQFHPRVMRWDGASIDQIRQFDSDKARNYADCSEEYIRLQKAFHELKPVALLLCVNDYKNYFIMTSKGKSAFATLEIGGVIYQGMLEIGISDEGIIYHMMFNNQVSHTLDQWLQIRNPLFETSLEDSLDNDTNVSQWCNKDGFEIAKQGDTYVVTLDIPTSTSFSNQPCRKLYIHPNKLSTKSIKKAA